MGIRCTARRSRLWSHLRAMSCATHMRDGHCNPATTLVQHMSASIAEATTAGPAKQDVATT